MTLGRYGQRGRDERAEGYDAVLELKAGGQWEWRENGSKALGPVGRT